MRARRVWLLVAAALGVAWAAEAGSVVRLQCTNCNAVIPGAGETGVRGGGEGRRGFAVGCGMMPGRRLGVVYCEVCKRFESVDLISRAETQKQIAEYEARLAAPGLDERERARLLHGRNSLQAALKRKPDDPLACPVCGTKRVELPIDERALHDKTAPRPVQALAVACPQCGRAALVAQATGLVWD